MLVELAVADLGVISELSLVLGPRMTALTGETGAGKTLLVGAIELLVGGRADAAMVRPGAEEARVEGRFVRDDGSEVVLARVVPAVGRSRAYVDGRLAPASALVELAADLVDLHGQHAHQSLLSTATQREALDRFGRVDLAPLTEATTRLRRIEEELAGLGGDARERARTLDLLRYQLHELEAAGLGDPDEEATLEAEEDLLAGAQAHREAAAAAWAALAGDGAAGDLVARAAAAVAGRPPFHLAEERLRSIAADLGDVAADLRGAAETIEEDPARLEAVRARRRLLGELRRKYGETLAEVIEYTATVRAELDAAAGHDERAARLERERVEASSEVAAAAAAVSAARSAAAPRLAAAVATHLGALAMPSARVDIVVEGEAGEQVTILLGANAGAPVLPLAKVASGGELARTMLALRLVLLEAGGGTDGRTLVFDEVDAGVGGEAALAVGRALAALGDTAQVLVVTHLPQVAAFADTQVAVSKAERGGTTVATVRSLDRGDRVVELSRMLSGQPRSETARGHAEELLAVAAAERGRP